MLIIGKRAKIAAFAAAIVIGFCGGALIEHFEGKTFIEETATTSEDAYIPSKLSSRNEEGKLNINAATAEELTELNGIGEKLAERIVNYRTENGKFTQTEGIMLVPGIGESVYAAIQDDICAE